MVKDSKNIKNSVGMNGQIYAFGTADQARKSVEGGLVPRDVLERMTDKDGKLKSTLKSTFLLITKLSMSVNFFLRVIILTVYFLLNLQYFYS